jgi:hypothetical protein
MFSSLVNYASLTPLVSLNQPYSDIVITGKYKKAPLPPGKNPFAVNKYYITLHYIRSIPPPKITVHIRMYSTDAIIFVKI